MLLFDLRLKEKQTDFSVCFSNGDVRNNGEKHMTFATLIFVRKNDIENLNLYFSDISYPLVRVGKKNKRIFLV